MPAELVAAENHSLSKMRQVFQTKFSIFLAGGKRLTYGNCLVACVASLLDERIDEVPNCYTFYGLADDQHPKGETPMWQAVLNLWLTNKHQKIMLAHSLTEPTQEEFVIMRGNSLRGKPHCCIFRQVDGKFIPYFDPHPAAQFLKEEHHYYTIETKQ